METKLDYEEFLQINQDNINNNGYNEKNLQNVEKEMEFYANKLHRVDQRIEVKILYNISYT